jgi:hypothetical protein
MCVRNLGHPSSRTPPRRYTTFGSQDISNRTGRAGRVHLTCSRQAGPAAVVAQLPAPHKQNSSRAGNPNHGNQLRADRMLADLSVKDLAARARLSRLQ